MKKALIAFLVLASFMISVMVTPAMALGPLNAAEVGNNPNLSILAGNPVLDNPSGSHVVWSEDSKSFWLDASEANGVMNNAIIADINTLFAMGASPYPFENKWIYLSGEYYGNTWNNPNDNPDRGTHGMFYWLLRALGFPHSYALNVALTRAPDGFYLKINHIGQQEG